jgi:hypothetical protein
LSHSGATVDISPASRSRSSSARAASTSSPGLTRSRYCSAACLLTSTVCAVGPLRSLLIMVVHRSLRFGTRATGGFLASHDRRCSLRRFRKPLRVPILDHGRACANASRAPVEATGSRRSRREDRAALTKPSDRIASSATSRSTKDMLGSMMHVSFRSVGEIQRGPVAGQQRSNFADWDPPAGRSPVP